MTDQTGTLLAPDAESSTDVFRNMTIGESGVVRPKSMAEVWCLASMICDGGLAPKGDNKSAVAIKITLGLEVGLSYMSAVANICVINGRPAMFGDMPLAVVRGSGLLEDFKEVEIGERETDSYGWTCSAKRKDTGEERSQTFTLGMARRAKLLDKAGPWTEHRERQCMWRARTWLLRDLFGDVLKGFRPAEELIDSPEIDITPQVTVGPAQGTERKAKPIIDPEKSLADQFDITDGNLESLHIDVLRAIAIDEGVGVDTSKMRTPGTSAAIKLNRAEKRKAAKATEDDAAKAKTEEGSKTECGHGVKIGVDCEQCIEEIRAMSDETPEAKVEGIDDPPEDDLNFGRE